MVGYFFGDNASKSVGNGSLSQISHSPRQCLMNWGFSGNFSVSYNQIDIMIGSPSDSTYISYLDLTKDFSFWEMVFFY